MKKRPNLIKDTFHKRSKERMLIAYFFLICSFAVLAYGTYTVFVQLNELMGKQTSGKISYKSEKKYGSNNADTNTVTGNSVNGASSDHSDDTSNNSKSDSLRLKIDSIIGQDIPSDGDDTKESSSEKTFGPYDIGNLLSRLIWVSLFFYIANIFIRLYKYNIGISDYYTSCVDAINIAQEYEGPFLKKLLSVYNSFTYSKVELEIPNEPKVEAPQLGK